MNELRVPIPLLRHFHALRPVSKHGFLRFNNASVELSLLESESSSSSFLALHGGGHTADLHHLCSEQLSNRRRRWTAFSSLCDATNLNFRGPEVFVSGSFFCRRSVVFFSSRYDVRCLSSGPGISTMTLSMASEAEAVCEEEDSSNGGCCSQIPIEERVYDHSSRLVGSSSDRSSPPSAVVLAGGNSLPCSNGQIEPGGDGGGGGSRRDANQEVLSSRVDVTGSGRGHHHPQPLSGRGQHPRGHHPEQPLSKTSQKSGPPTPENLAHASPLLSTEGGESREEDRPEVDDEGLAKRLRREEEDPIIRDSGVEEMDRRIARAWDHWRKLGEPKFHVAPMVDQSELPFRMLCRKYGATAAYTPMLHSRLFAQESKYRSKEFTTCPEDRPLFVQFCANNPDTLLKAAQFVEPHCDYVDINLGCPQRIAKKGNYGAFLMDNLPLIKSLVSNLASNLSVPVSCKIRVFPNLEDTLAYARMLEEAGCSLLAVHGRTRDQKNGKLIRADWDAIRAVKKALRIPVLANGNIRWLEDAYACMAYTGVNGVMSAESLLENPALYGGYRMAHSVEDINLEASGGEASGGAKIQQQQTQKIDERVLMLEYLNLCEKYPVPMRMVRGHVHKILGSFWFPRNSDIRAELNKQHQLTLEWLKDMVHRLMARSASNNNSPLCQDVVLDTQVVLQEQPGVSTSAATVEALPHYSPSQDVIISV